MVTQRIDIEKAMARVSQKTTLEDVALAAWPELAQELLHSINSRQELPPSSWLTDPARAKAVFDWYAGTIFPAATPDYGHLTSGQYAAALLIGPERDAENSADSGRLTDNPALLRHITQADTLRDALKEANEQAFLKALAGSNWSSPPQAPFSKPDGPGADPTRQNP